VSKVFENLWNLLPDSKKLPYMFKGVRCVLRLMIIRNFDIKQLSVKFLINVLKFASKIENGIAMLQTNTAESLEEIAMEVNLDQDFQQFFSKALAEKCLEEPELVETGKTFLASVNEVTKRSLLL
jgi:hypothetical protein